jgi:hypothetical protein
LLSQLTDHTDKRLAVFDAWHPTAKSDLMHSNWIVDVPGIRQDIPDFEPELMRRLGHDTVAEAKFEVTFVSFSFCFVHREKKYGEPDVPMKLLGDAIVDPLAFSNFWFNLLVESSKTVWTEEVPFAAAIEQFGRLPDRLDPMLACA